MPGTIKLVATENEEVTGLISVLVNPPNMQGKLLWEKIRPYIGFLGVAEGHRRRGIGSELIREAERGAFAVTGAGSIYLECEHENEKALRLYHKLGLTRVNPDEIQKTLGGPLSKNSGLYRAERKSLE